MRAFGCLQPAVDLLAPLIDAGDDPPVYLWEGRKRAGGGTRSGGLYAAIREHEHFSGFVLAQARTHVAYLRRAGSYPHQPTYRWS